MPTDILDKPPVEEDLDRGRPGGACASPGGDGEPESGSPGIFGDPARFGLWAFLGTLTMLFVGFTSAYLVRRASADWRPLSPPPVLWLNTAVLLASSGTLGIARRRLRDWQLREARGWLGTTGILGGLFVAGQLLAWRRLVAQGIYLSSNPHSSFFYVLTGLHIAHLLGGLIWFCVVQARVVRMACVPGEDSLGLFATYWHFLGALWVYLFMLLFVI